MPCACGLIERILRLPLAVHGPIARGNGLAFFVEIDLSDLQGSCVSGEAWACFWAVVAGDRAFDRFDFRYDCFLPLSDSSPCIDLVPFQPSV